MATDRAAPAAIAVLIAGHSGPSLRGHVCAFFTIVDIISHWIRFTLAQRVQTHHKLLASRFALLRFYYKNKPFLTAECMFYEAFFIGSLAAVSCTGLLAQMGTVIAKISFPGTVLKTFISLEQLVDAIEYLSAIDAEQK